LTITPLLPHRGRTRQGFRGTKRVEIYFEVTPSGRYINLLEDIGFAIEGIEGVVRPEEANARHILLVVGPWFNVSKVAELWMTRVIEQLHLLPLEQLEKLDGSGQDVIRHTMAVDSTVRSFGAPDCW
jgi:hypothetical protein